MKKILSLLALAAVMTACSGDGDYDAMGTFEATEVTVSARGTGEIKSLSIVEGQEVDSGRQLGYIDMTQLELQSAQFDANQEQLTANKQQLDASKDQLDAGKLQLDANQSATGSHVLNLDSQVAAIRQQIANLQKEKARFTAMLKDDAASQKQVDDITYQILVLEKQLSATQEQISKNNRSFADTGRGLEDQKRGVDAQKRGIDAQKRGIDAQSRSLSAQKAQIEDRMLNSIITSPVKGTILTKYAERGEYAVPGKPLFKVADMNTVFLRAYFTSDQLSKLKVGQQVKVVADFGGGNTRDYAGRITWIAGESEFTPKTIQTSDTRANLVYAVKIAVQNDGYLKLGLYGKVIL